MYNKLIELITPERREKIRNLFFPVLGGSTGAGAKTIQHSEHAMQAINDYSSWIDFPFIANVAVSAIVGGVVGYLVKYGLDKVFKKEK